MGFHTPGADFSIQAQPRLDPPRVWPGLFLKLRRARVPIRARRSTCVCPWTGQAPRIRCGPLWGPGLSSVVNRIGLQLASCLVRYPRLGGYLHGFEIPVGADLIEPRPRIFNTHQEQIRCLLFDLLQVWSEGIDQRIAVLLCE